MSLGATMSAPARAWETAVFASHSRVDVVVHVVVFHKAAMTMAGVFAIAHVSHHQQLRHCLLIARNRPLRDAVVRVGSRSEFILLRRNAEQDHAAEPKRGAFFALPDQLVHGHLRLARHR